MCALELRTPSVAEVDLQGEGRLAGAAQDLGRHDGPHPDVEGEEVSTVAKARDGNPGPNAHKSAGARARPAAAAGRTGWRRVGGSSADGQAS